MTINFTDSRDNITAIEAQIIEGDNREWMLARNPTESEIDEVMEADRAARKSAAPYPPTYPVAVYGRKATMSQCQCENCTA
jgi:hypothetical protein